MLVNSIYWYRDRFSKRKVDIDCEGVNEWLKRCRVEDEEIINAWISPRDSATEAICGLTALFTMAKQGNTCNSIPSPDWYSAYEG